MSNFAGFEDWLRRHLDADPQEPASPPRPNQRPEDFEPFEREQCPPWSAKFSVTEPNSLQIGPDREQLRDYEPFMSSVSAGARAIEQRFSQGVEDSLAEWTEANGS